MYSFFVGCDMSKDFFDASFHNGHKAIYLVSLTITLMVLQTCRLAYQNKPIVLNYHGLFVLKILEFIQKLFLNGW